MRLNKRLLAASIALSLGISGSAHAGWFDDATGWVSGAVSDTTNWVSGAAEDTTNWISGAAEDTTDWVSGAAVDTGSFVEDTAIDVVDFIGDTAESAFNSLAGSSFNGMSAGAPQKGQLPILDSQGRELILQGIADGSNKHTFMRRPNETAEEVVFQAKQLGFNTQRYLIFWDHIMPTKGVINYEYLADVKVYMDRFAENNVHVILDMHQDNWSEACDGNGAPSWATIGESEPAPGAPWWIIAASPCVVDSVNLFFKNHDGWMDEYVKSWSAVAEYFKDHPAVFGYDLMNEPNRADAIVDQMINEMLPLGTTENTALNLAVKTTTAVGGFVQDGAEGIIRTQMTNMAAAQNLTVPDSYLNKMVEVIMSRNAGDWGSLNAVADFEGGSLTYLYQQLINAIREIDQDKYIFFEPMSASANNGVSTKLGYLNDPGTNGRRLGYIPHMYPRALHEGGAYGDVDLGQMDDWERVSREFVHHQNLAFMIGEYGHSNNAADGTYYIKDAVRMAERNKLSWQYWDRGTGWGPYNNDTMELQNNAAALINIFPRATAGKLIDYHFNRNDKTFEMSFYNKAGVTGTTDISIPPSVFDNGFVVESTDAETNWSYTFDDNFGVLSVSHDPDVAEHTITIKPTSDTQVSHYRELLEQRNGHCLDPHGKRAMAGNSLVTVSCAGKTWQQWAYDEQEKFVRSYQDSNICISHGDSSEAVEGHALILAACTDSDDLRWNAVKKSGGFTLANIYNSNLVMDSAGTHSGAAVVQRNANNGKNQLWQWGWKDNYGDMDEVIASMAKGQAYDLKVIAKANTCALEWSSHLDGNAERNAKWDCSSAGDPVRFNAYSNPIVRNGIVSITGSLHSNNAGCGLEWDGTLDSGNERNAKWDCSGSSDQVTITTTLLGQSVKITSKNCGLEWGAGIDGNNERNAKWDCSGRHDDIKLHQVEPLVRVTGEIVNLSLGKVASQSTTRSAGGAASRAVDGNTSGAWGNNSVTHTNTQRQPWWQVDLGDVRELTEVKLYNRTDCCTSRLANFHVLISEQPFGNRTLSELLSDTAVFKHFYSGAAASSVTIPTRLSGRYVRVQLSGSADILSLAEVQVMGGSGESALVTSDVDAGIGWSKLNGALKHVSVAADGTVWGISANDSIYRRDGNSWTKIPGALKQISVGSANHVWGVNSSDYIYRWTGSGWQNISGRLKQVSVAADGTVWGVSANDNIYRRDGNSWTRIPGGLKQISVGSASKVWAVNKWNNIWSWDGSNWHRESGSLKYIDIASDGSIWGIDSNNQVFVRKDNDWVQVAGSLKQISIGSVNRILGISSAGSLLKRMF